MKTSRWSFADKDLFLIALIAFVLYLSLSIVKPERIFWSLDEGGKWIYLENVLRTGDPGAPLAYPGRWLDSQLENVALHFYQKEANEIYSWWPVGFPLLTLPFYRLFGWPGLYLLPALAGATVAYLSGKITREVTQQSRLFGVAATVTVALATPVFFYSTMFWEHTLAVACLIGFVYLLLQFKKKQNWWTIFLAGVLASLSVFFRTETGLLVAGIGLAVLVFLPLRKIPVLAAGTLLTTASWMMVNYWLMGGLFGPNTASIQNLTQFIGVESVGKKFIPYVLFNAPTVAAFSLGKNLLIIGTVFSVLAFVAGLWREARWLSSLFLVVVIAVCAYVLFQPALYRSVHGFVLICPLVIVSSWVYGTQAWKTHTWVWLIFTAGILVYAVGYYLQAWVAAGGLQWGPRYMLGLYPLMIIAIMAGIWDIHKTMGGITRSFISIVAVLAILVAFGYQVRGYWTMNLTMQLYRQSAQGIGKLGDKIIHTPCTWLSMVIPDLYWQGNIFANRSEDVLIEEMKRNKRENLIYLEMVSCNTDPLDIVMKNYERYQDGIIIEQVDVAR